MPVYGIHDTRDNDILKKSAQNEINIVAASQTAVGCNSIDSQTVLLTYVRCRLQSLRALNYWRTVILG